MRYCHLDFIYNAVSNYYEIIDYVGKNKLILIPEFYEGLPVKKINLDAFKHDSKKVIILNNQIEMIHPFSSDMNDEIVIYQQESSNVIFDITPSMIIRKGLIKVIEDGVLYYALLSDGTANIIHSDILEFRFESLGRFGEQILIEEKIEEHSIVGIEHYAFMNVINLHAISIPKTVQWIGRKTFYNVEMLDEIFLQDSVKYVGYQAFSYCLNLKRVYLMSDQIELEDQVFENSYRAMLYFASSKRYMEITSDFNPDLLPVALGYEKDIIIDSVVYALLDDKTAVVNGLYTNDFIDLNLPDEVEGYKIVEIAPFAFYQEKLLQSIKMSNNITAINSSAFAESHIKKITLSNALRVIDDALFSGCIYLKSIVIHEGVEIIQEGAFQGCISLSQVKLPSSIVIINTSSFARDYRLKNINFPEGLEEIKPYAFSESNLKDIILPSTLNSIGEMSFGNITKIKKLSFGNDWININEGAFMGSKVMTCQVKEKEIKHFNDWLEKHIFNRINIKK